MIKEATMSINIRIIHAKDFIKATPEGKLDLENSKKILLEIASATRSYSDFEIILDTRKAQVEMSVVDLWCLAEELGNFRKAFSKKTAVLCPAEKFNFAEFFALCAQNRGIQVMAFTSFEEAIEWLTV
jgi:hypothetical protein